MLAFAISYHSESAKAVLVLDECVISACLCTETLASSLLHNWAAGEILLSDSILQLA